MIPDIVMKAHRIAAFIAVSSPENTPFFADFCEIFRGMEAYKEMTPAQSMEAQADLKMRMEFLNDIKISDNYVLGQVLQEILKNLVTMNEVWANAEAKNAI